MKRERIKKVFHIICISLIVLGSIARIVEGAIPSRENSGGGSKKENNESIHRTIVTLNEILVKEPDNQEVLMKLGDIYRELHAYDEAVVFYNRVLKLDPKDILAHLSLGEVYLKQRKYELAEKEYKTVSDLDPDDLNIIKGLLMLSFAIGELDKSLQYGAQLLKKDPDDAMTLNIMGIIYIEKRQIEKAISTFKHALSLEENSTVHQNLSIAYMLNKSYDAAERQLKKVIELEPDDYQSFKNIGIFYLEMKDFSKALFYLKEAFILNPRDIELYHCLAHIHEERGDLKEAVNYYRMSISFYPTNIFSLLNLARLYYKMDKTEESLNLCRKVLEIKPQNKQANSLITSIKNKEEMVDIGKSNEQVLNQDRFLNILKKRLDRKRKQYLLDFDLLND